MFDLILCGFSLSCQVRTLQDYFNAPKYPQEVYEICSYYEQQKIRLPDYCQMQIIKPRKRNEF